MRYKRSCCCFGLLSFLLWLSLFCVLVVLPPPLGIDPFMCIYGEPVASVCMAACYNRSVCSSYVYVGLLKMWAFWHCMFMLQRDSSFPFAENLGVWTFLYSLFPSVGVRTLWYLWVGQDPFGECAGVVLLLFVYWLVSSEHKQPQHCGSDIASNTVEVYVGVAILY